MKKDSNFKNRNKLVRTIFFLIAIICVFNYGLKQNKSNKNNTHTLNIDSPLVDDLIIDKNIEKNSIIEQDLSHYVLKIDNISNNITNSYVAQGLDISPLINFNKKTIGVIGIPGTKIYLPFCSSTSDEEWDHTLYNGKNNIHGTIYMDKNNHELLLDKVTVLYGHNMKDGTMFRDLNRFLDKKYFDEHKYLFLIRENDISIYQLACASVIDEDDLSFKKYNFKTEDDYNSYINNVLCTAVNINEGINLNEEEKLLQLVTCHKYKKNRTVIYFTRESVIPNILNDKNDDITDTEIKKKTVNFENFYDYTKNLQLYKTLNANFIVFNTFNQNDKFYIWTKNDLNINNKNEIFTELRKRNIDIQNCTFIYGNNQFNVGENDIYIQKNASGIDLIAEENTILDLISGNYQIESLNQDKTLKLTLG